MAGNVWEWTADYYDANLHQSKKGVCPNANGPEKCNDPEEPYATKRVIKGGSFLCNEKYCESYRPSARRGQTPDTGTSHIGFRLVKDKNA